MNPTMSLIRTSKTKGADYFYFTEEISSKSTWSAITRAIAWMFVIPLFLTHYFKIISNLQKSYKNSCVNISVIHSNSWVVHLLSLWLFLVLLVLTTGNCKHYDLLHLNTPACIFLRARTFSCITMVHLSKSIILTLKKNVNTDTIYSFYSNYAHWLIMFSVVKFLFYFFWCRV